MDAVEEEAPFADVDAPGDVSAYSEGGDGGDFTEEEDDDSVTLKYLIPDTAAGSIIGKGGSTINEMQTQTGARIQLSRNDETFPGTTDRVVILAGAVGAVLSAMHLMIAKLIADDALRSADPSLDAEEEPEPQIRLVIPNASCGCVIGRGWATIRGFAEDSGARIKLSSQDRMLPGVTDRVLTVTGPVDRVLRAVALVATALMDDESYAALAARPSTYASGGGLPQGGAEAPSEGGPSAAGGRGRRGGGKQVTLTVAVPDEHVGAVLGKGGRTISEIQIKSGARIKVSDRGDFVEGTRNRKLTLTGTPEGTAMAQYLLAQKLSSPGAPGRG